MARLCGILGGMGIDVTAALLERIIDRTPAAREQEHLPLIINHNPRIPDRTAALLDGGEDPLPHLVRSLAMLERAGAAFIAIPCNTAHHYYDAMREAVSVPIIHMLRETALRCLETAPGLRCAGLLATSGTVRTGLYQRCFAEHDVEVLSPADALQAEVMGHIMDIKARKPVEPLRAGFASVAEHLVQRGAEVIILGCTDISLAVRAEDCQVPVVDSLSVLADTVVQWAQEGNRDGRN